MCVPLVNILQNTNFALPELRLSNNNNVFILGISKPYSYVFYRRYHSGMSSIEDIILGIIPMSSVGDSILGCLL